MSWWQTVVLAYFVLTPWSEILTAVVVMMTVQEWRKRHDSSS